MKSATTPLPTTTTPTTINMEFRSTSILDEDWTNSQQLVLGTPSSVASSLFEVCRCCSRQNCEHLEYYNRTMKKLESDTRLAAEIGQGLLHKHETYVAESSQQRAQLEKQLNECHERIAGLEQSLDEVENQKDDIAKEKNKWLWEYQKRQKILDETVADLEMTNEKCSQLEMDLKIKESELQKLRLYKFMARHAESNEATLTSKLEDTNQELAICRKNELVLESKIKKLKIRYESLYSNHEQLSRQVQENAMILSQAPRTESDTIKASFTQAHHLFNSVCIHMISYFILIKELSSANTKLKSDLINCKEQLSESRGEVIALNQKLEDSASSTTEQDGKRLQDDIKASIKRSKKLKRATSVKDEATTTSSAKKKVGLPIRSKTTMQPPLPSVSSSMPTSSLASSPVVSPNSKNAVVHHHYHYYVKNSRGERIQITDDMDSSSSKSTASNCSSHEIMLDYSEVCLNRDLGTRHELMRQQHNTLDDMDNMPPPPSQQQQQQQPNQRELVPTPSTSSVITIKDGTVTTSAPGLTKSPFILLQEHVTQVLDRLRGSDIRALNRRLKRAFEITELSNMSNSIIDNILMDVDILDTRFLWVNTADTDTLAFFPLVDLLKDMLKELGILRNTMNELQVEYVKKVEESGLRVEEEIIKKRQLKRESTLKLKSSKSTSTADANSNTRPLSWLANMFSNNNKQPEVCNTSSNTTTPSSITTASTASTTDHHYYDRGSTLTKTTTNSSTLILSPSENADDDVDEGRFNTLRKLMIATTASALHHEDPTPHTKYARNVVHPTKRRQIPYLPPVMSTSVSNNTTRPTPAIPIRSKRSLHRMHIDYEGIGPAAIRPIPSDRDNSTTNFSSSWLGGK
ncbi:uncharacterized protein ATC70_009615 [Mucor velutinosus]|uniref:Uncharacterized protein n=1 Tax=Mucor velutinosus TaxID=708070 RepID=A0AAN7HV52_9FUNG|nr:hypothetical protein ATC70_009615 [Mucor velutinosus]